MSTFLLCTIMKKMIVVNLHSEHETSNGSNRVTAEKNHTHCSQLSELLCFLVTDVYLNCCMWSWIYLGLSSPSAINYSGGYFTDPRKLTADGGRNPLVPRKK